MKIESIKGSVVAAYTEGAFVKICVSSPTGDSTDTFTFTLPCHNLEQARAIAGHWRAVWDVPPSTVRTRRYNESAVSCHSQECIVRPQRGGERIL